MPAAAAAGDAAAGPWAEVPPTLREAAGAAAGAELSRVVEFPAQVRLGGRTRGDARMREGIPGMWRVAGRFEAGRRRRHGNRRWSDTTSDGNVESVTVDRLTIDKRRHGNRIGMEKKGRGNRVCVRMHVPTRARASVCVLASWCAYAQTCACMRALCGECVCRL